MDDSPREPLPTVKRDFAIALGIFELLGITSILLLVGWSNKYQSATWEWRENPEQEFYYHPLLATIAFVLVHGNANLIYRIFKKSNTKLLEWVHALLQFLAWILIIVALVAVFDSHNMLRDNRGRPTPYPNMYSLHSWVGISIAILFTFQFLAGFVAFLYPKVNILLRTQYVKIHVFFGISIYGLFIIQAVLGLTEEDFYDVSGFENKSAEATMVNCIGYILVLFGLTGMYLLVSPKFRRPPKPEDDYRAME